MFKKEVQERQDRLVALDEMRVDMKLMTSMAKADTCGNAVAKQIVTGIGLPGSFRKLEID